MTGGKGATAKGCRRTGPRRWTIQPGGGGAPKKPAILTSRPVGTDLAKVDRGVATGSIRAHQAPEEADHIVMHIDAAHELEPRAGPAGLNRGDVTAKGFTSRQ
jgi:hypothetical protein